MNFKEVWANLVDKPTTYSSSELGNKLKLVVDKRGVGIFKDATQLSSVLDEANIGGTIKQQLLLISACSNIGDFVANSKSDLDLVDVDNTIHNVITSTGLTYHVAVRLITDIFFSCGMDFAVEYGFVFGKNGLERRLHALMPNELVDKEVKRVEKLFNSYIVDTNNEITTKTEIAQEAVAGINKLCEAGIPNGFLLLGKCYLNGHLGTEKDLNKAKEYLSIASDMGILEASALLGDIHYSTEYHLLRDYTTAHYFYTRPGALALGKKQRNALHDIYMQGSVNLFTLIMGGIVFVLSIFFAVNFHSGIFSGAECVVMAAITNVLSGSLWGFAIFFYIRKRYNNLRGFIVAQYMVWAFYAYLVLLA